MMYVGRYYIYLSCKDLILFAQGFDLLQRFVISRHKIYDLIDPYKPFAIMVWMREIRKLYTGLMVLPMFESRAIQL